MECHCNRNLAYGLRAFVTEREAEVQDAIAVILIGGEVSTKRHSPAFKDAINDWGLVVYLHGVSIGE